MINIVLGLLALEPLTIYEMRNFIRDNLQSICSDGMGSIQAAIKKLLEKELIYFEEGVENGINKKRYFITEAGRVAFSEWVEHPMIAGKTKNMELSKLFFMDAVPKERRVHLIDEYLEALNKERAYFEGIANLFNQQKKTANLKDYRFQFVTLEYGIKQNLFEIQFYEELREQLLKDES